MIQLDGFRSSIESTHAHVQCPHSQLNATCLKIEDSMTLLAVSK